MFGKKESDGNPWVALVLLGFALVGITHVAAKVTDRFLPPKAAAPVEKTEAHAKNPKAA